MMQEDCICDLTRKANFQGGGAKGGSWTLLPINLLLSLLYYTFPEQIAFSHLYSNYFVNGRTFGNKRTWKSDPALSNPGYIIFKPMMGPSLPKEQIGDLSQISFLPNTRKLGHQALPKHHVQGWFLKPLLFF